MVRANPTVRGEGREKRGRGGKKWGGGRVRGRDVRDVRKVIFL